MMKGKILIAEDEKKIRSLLRLYLEQNEYTVITAKNGRVALERMKENTVDLIVLDILMPELSGLDVCKELRKNYKYKDVPVIYLSSLNEKQSIISGLEIGGDDYMTKPFDPNELVARINAILRRTKNNRGEKTDIYYEDLTFQETQIVELMERGFTNKEIALKLSLTEGTVKVYNHTIYQKLQVRNRTQAIVRAKEIQLI
ncbi:response regulator transcription factor [Pseudogracilibacillus auburnensis]|uniref:LuxR family two component transcriptional regulator n=1 Tax=Pseudogracilibacillus auburnensis TaxID=1494959 RepID=A0A2V3VZK5_9BACI|nr:response regulator transcription factor [Pseudogracilibacillus auburnensis]PXW86228.1 LuxR family two component transcriptional regulator [Pseudogracilibacillus auburnensis]